MNGVTPSVDSYVVLRIFLLGDTSLIYGLFVLSSLSSNKVYQLTFYTVLIVKISLWFSTVYMFLNKKY